MVDETVNEPPEESTGFTEACGVAEFAGRLNAVRLHHGIRSTTAFARFLGIPNNSMRSYLKGENDPTREKLVHIASKCGVSLEWLATGNPALLPDWYREVLGIQMYEPSPDGKTLIPTQEYRQLTGPAPPAVAEAAAEPPSPPPTLNVDKLQQAIDILRALGGPQALSADNAAARLAAAYDVLIGNKP